MLGTVEDTVEKGKAADDGSGLVLAVEIVKKTDEGDSVGALVVGEEGLGCSVVGVSFGVEVRSEVECVDGAADGNVVLRVLLRAGDVVSENPGLLVRLASLEMEVLEVLVEDIVGVVISVMIYGTMCGTVVVLWVEVAGKKADIS